MYAVANVKATMTGSQTPC